MKKIFIFLLIPTISILLTGCPLSADYPIDSPNIKVDISMLGKWQDATGKSSIGGQKGIFIVTKKSEFVYTIETSAASTEAPGSENQVTNYEGHISDINGTKFINIKNSDGKYLLFKLEVAGNNCILTEISMCIDKTFSNSAEVKAFILKHIDNELLYSGSQTFFRN
jgi:hypothetical protein